MSLQCDFEKTIKKVAFLRKFEHFCEILFRQYCMDIKKKLVFGKNTKLFLQGKAWFSDGPEGYCLLKKNTTFWCLSKGTLLFENLELFAKKDLFMVGLLTIDELLQHFCENHNFSGKGTFCKEQLCLRVIVAPSTLDS